MSEFKIFKIVLIGTKRSGKASFINLFLKNLRSEVYEYSNFIRIYFSDLRFTFSLYGALKLYFWDISEEATAAELYSYVLSGTNTFLLFLDLSDYNSISELECYLKRLRQFSGKVPIILIGTMEKPNLKGNEGIINKFIRKYKILKFFTINNKLGFNNVNFIHELTRIIVPEIECDFFGKNIFNGDEKSPMIRKDFIFRLLNRIRARKYHYKDTLKYLHPPNDSCTPDKDLYYILQKRYLGSPNITTFRRIPFVLNGINANNDNIKDNSEIIIPKENKNYTNFHNEITEINQLWTIFKNLNLSCKILIHNYTENGESGENSESMDMHANNNDMTPLMRLRNEMLEELERLRTLMENGNIIQISSNDIDSMDISDEEKEKAKKFISFFSTCPICREENHESYLINFYFSKDPEDCKLKEKLLRFVNDSEIISNICKSEIKIGIPCCKCYELFFNDDKQ
ncbi:MAG: Rab family GTPase [Promethearchaeota archaeon]